MLSLFSWYHVVNFCRVHMIRLLYNYIIIHHHILYYGSLKVNGVSSYIIWITLEITNSDELILQQSVCGASNQA